MMLNSLGFIIWLSIAGLYPQSWNLSSRGTIVYKLNSKVLQEWSLPEDIKSKVAQDFPKAKLQKTHNEFEICMSNSVRFRLREMNSRLVVVDKGRCEWSN